MLTYQVYLLYSSREENSSRWEGAFRRRHGGTYVGVYGYGDAGRLFFLLSGKMSRDLFCGRIMSSL